MPSLDDVRRRFIVDESEYEEKIVASIIELANRFVKVGKTGQVYIDFLALANKDKVALVFIGRFLASILEKGIDRKVTNEEATRYAGLDARQASARISELVKEGLLEKIGRGTHRVIALFKVDQYLKNLVERYDYDI